MQIFHKKVKFFSMKSKTLFISCSITFVKDEKMFELAKLGKFVKVNGNFIFYIFNST